MIGKNMKAIMILYVVLVFIFMTACSRGDTRPIPHPPQAADEMLSYSVSAWPAIALLETGENPLWFELGPEGPIHIQSPETASFAPFLPWPHARFVVGILAWDDFLVMTINRDGFLVLGIAGEVPDNADKTRAVLYRIAGNDLWYPYTIESFFIWRDRPAALLYRNDFFAEAYAPSPRPQVFVLDKSSPVPLGALVPALERFPPGENWEAELLRRGADGYWYYRMREKGSSQNQTAYFRARDLEGEGEEISMAVWRDSAFPDEQELYSNSLPVLPEGFVYTGMAVLGNIVLASWEERLDAGIGAAGFMACIAPLYSIE